MSRTTTNSSATSVPDTLAVVTFTAGGYRFAVEAARVCMQLPAEQSDSVLAVEQLLGLLSREDTQNRATQRILLIMKHPAGDYAVAVSKPVELLSIEINAIYPLPSLIVARCTLVGLRGLAIDPEGMLLLVDLNEAKAQ